MFKYKAGQKVRVFAFNLSDGTPATGDAANITCEYSLDYATPTGLTDTNPDEVQDGFYRFGLEQVETSGSVIEFYPVSSTTGVQVIVAPGINTEVNLSAQGLDSILIEELTADFGVGDSVKRMFDMMHYTTKRKQSFNKTTGIQTFYDSTGNSGVLECTHADDGNVYSVTNVAKT